MSVPPLFPRLKPKSIDPSWFDVDQPCDDEEEVSQLEAQHQAWVVMNIVSVICNLIYICCSCNPFHNGTVMLHPLVKQFVRYVH